MRKGSTTEKKENKEIKKRSEEESKIKRRIRPILHDQGISCVGLYNTRTVGQGVRGVV